VKGDKFKHLTVFSNEEEVDIWYIEKFEKKVGYCLPKTYKELMVKYNGVRFYEDYFSFLDKKGEKDLKNFLFLSFGEKEEVTEHIDDAQYVSHPDYYGIVGLVGFASTGEGDTVCFDYRKSQNECEPQIIVLVHDEHETHQDESVTRVVEFVANTFDDFLMMLYED